MWVSLALRLARTPFLWSGHGLMRDLLIVTRGGMSGVGCWSPEARQGPVFNPKGVIQPWCLDSWGHVFSIHRRGSWQADTPAASLVAWGTRPVIRPGS